MRFSIQHLLVLTLVMALVIQAGMTGRKVTTFQQWVDYQQDQRRRLEETVGEIYRLRRTKEGWRVYENRYWPIQSTSIDVITKYDAETWRRLDADVDRIKQEGDPARIFSALQAAHRWQEAHNLSKTVIADSRSALEWVSRAAMALLVGDVDDAISCFKKAKEIEPQFEIPSVVN